MMAVATMIWPRLRRMKFISRTTIATILMEEMESAVPRNSDGTSRPPGHALKQQAPGRTDPAESRRRRERRCRTARWRSAAPAGFAHQLEIGLHAGQQQQHQDADLRQAIDHALLGFVVGKDEMLRRRPQPAEQGWSQNDARQQACPSARAGRCAACPRPARRPTTSSSRTSATSRASDLPLLLAPLPAVLPPLWRSRFGMPCRLCAAGAAWASDARAQLDGGEAEDEPQHQELRARAAWK